jgi:Protein of unknown function (DUF3108)
MTTTPAATPTATATIPGPASASVLAPVLRSAQVRAATRVRRALVVTLLLSLSVHLALTEWPVDVASTPESTPLTATLTELPPPPKPAAIEPPPAPKAKPKPKPRPRATPAMTPAPVAEVTEVQPQEALPAKEAAATEAAASAPAPENATTTAGADITPGAVTSGKTLPPRVDLAYKVFYGTQGFLIGEAVYRFEHAGNRYRIATVGEARGLAALVLRGQGKIESRGLITGEGLQPLIFRVERGGPDRVETATFDWEAGMLTMRNNETVPLDLPTFDPLALMWQYYFTPPTESAVSFTVATPRRLYRYTMTRDGEEEVPWQHGSIDAERWHRRSEDGKTDAYVWLAPKLRHLPVKMRVSNTARGTIEVLLASIRVDESATGMSRDELVVPLTEAHADAAAPMEPLAPPRPAETFPVMTGQ